MTTFKHFPEVVSASATSSLYKTISSKSLPDEKEKIVVENRMSLPGTPFLL
jgi:hypothetical protein